MELISETALEDFSQKEPTYPAVFPFSGETMLGDASNFTKGQPFEHFAKIRKDAPVAWCNIPFKDTRGFWSITRYEDVKAIEINSELFSSQKGTINLVITQKNKRFPKKLGAAAMDALINLDAPHHMELRIQHKDYFIPRYVKEITDRIANKVDSLLDEMESQGPVVDFAKVFAKPLTLYTLCEMLGVDEVDRPKIDRWMNYIERALQVITKPLTTIITNPFLLPMFVKNVNEMFDYGEAVMADRRASPREDLLSVIAKAKLDGSELTQEWLDGSWLLIIFAGNDTTRNSLSGAMRLLTEFPDQKQMVIDDPSLIPRMIEEALRMVSPVMHMRRTATRDTELHGQKIAKGEKVVLWYGAANRDPSVFENPDQFNIERENASKHLAFGHGPHKCLGSRIAQLQLRLAFQKILERFPDIEWTGKQVIEPNNFVHGIRSLQVDLYGGRR